MTNITLYKKDSSGKIRVLSILQEEGEVTRLTGVLNGAMVEHKYTAKPKNIGKSNETTSTEQAILEVTALITKKLSEGYFETIEEAEILNVIKPMLAKSYNDESSKIDWSNAYVQPKLDGMRCLKLRTTMRSRQAKLIDTLPHINPELSFINEQLDGELYAYGLSFQNNMRLIKKNRPLSVMIKYHVYDLNISDRSFINRYNLLKSILESNADSIKHIELVPTFKVTSYEEVKQYHSQFLSEGYEGTMVRWGDEGYKINSRSSNLLKYKDFLDNTYEVVDVVPSDKIPNQGVVICKGINAEGNLFTFGCGMKFSHQEREDILTNKSDYIGRIAEVRFFEFTDDDIPRFPVCVGFRLDK